MKKLFLTVVAGTLFATTGCVSKYDTTPRSDVGSPNIDNTEVEGLMNWARETPGAQRKWHHRDADCRWNEYYGWECRAREDSGSAYRHYY